MATPTSSADRERLPTGALRLPWDFHTHAPAYAPGVTLPPGAIHSFSLMDGAWLTALSRGEGLGEGIATGEYTIGLHPWDTDRPAEAEALLKQLPSYLSHPCCVALGECGLDRKRGAELKVQESYFTRQLAIATQAGKPLVIHCHGAWAELLACMKRAKYAGCVALHHAQSLPLSLIAPLREMGWYFSLGPRRGGYPPARIAMIPDAALLVESDGEGCDPRSVYHSLAQAKGMEIEPLIELVARNTLRFKHGEAAGYGG